MIRLPAGAVSAPASLIALTLLVAAGSGAGLVAGVAAAVRPGGILPAVPAAFSPAGRPTGRGDARQETAQLTPGPGGLPDTAAPDAAAPAPEAARATLPATLMLTPDELNGIDAALAAGPLARSRAPLLPLATATRAAPRQTQPLHVSGIVYQGPGAWTVWINGRAFSPGDPTGVVVIEAVSPSAVRLSVPWGEAGRKAVQLAANQTFVPRLGEVVEGHVTQ